MVDAVLALTGEFPNALFEEAPETDGQEEEEEKAEVWFKKGRRRKKGPS